MGEEKDCDKGAAPTVKMQPQQQWCWQRTTTFCLPTVPFPLM
jgi:hypothetical protein